LREILIQNVNNSKNDITSEVAENVKYAIILIGTVPILCAYQFLQRYFVKGVMIEAPKG
jgi:putative aldouronate transport system permease protein